MTKHTPGPWKVGPVDDTRVVDARGNEVAQIDGDYNQPDTWPLMEANARLISAAPDMLEALEALQDGWSKDAITAGSWAKARSAIAKAKGEA